MFWKVTGLNMTSPVDALLDKSQCTLEELLREEDLIQECRSLNGRLVNFLSTKENVDTMLDYMTKPIEDTKLSWQCCEVFCCEVDPIFSVFFDNQSTMEKFLSTLDEDSPLDATIAGYFGRVMNSLFLRRPVQLTQYLKDNSRHIERLISHLEDTSVTDIVLKLLGADEQTASQLSSSYVNWISETNILHQLMDRLKASEPERVQDNASQILVGLIRSQQVPLAERLANETNLDTLLEYLFHENGEVSVPVLNVVITALDPQKRLINGIPIEQIESTCERISDDNTFGQLIQKLIALLSVFRDRLDRYDHLEEQLTPYGSLKPPLGKSRLKIIKLLSILATAGGESVMDALVDSKILRICTQLFTDYPFNNLLHKNVVSIIASCLKSKHDTMLEHLIGDLRIYKWISDLPEMISDSKTTKLSREKAESDDNGEVPEIRAGYMGHVVVLANQIVQEAQSNDHLLERLKEDIGWQKFINNKVVPTNRRFDVSAWTCGRPQNSLSMERSMEESHDPMSSGPDPGTGILRFSPAEAWIALCSEEFVEEKEERKPETRRPENSLRSDKDSVTGTTAMFARVDLQEAGLHQSTGSTSSDDSSSPDSSSSNSSDGEGDNVVTVSSQAVLLGLTEGVSGGEEVVSSESADTSPDLIPFNDFRYWKVDIRESEDLPDLD